MKVTIDSKQLVQSVRPMLAEELASLGCIVRGNVLSVCVTDFTKFLQAYGRFLSIVSRNAMCMQSCLVRLTIITPIYVIVESETTQRRIGVSMWYDVEEKGFHYKYQRDE